MLSAHTSPLDQPGVGDAGGMNVYVLELARRLAARGIEVDIFTRATSSQQPSILQMADGIRVRHVAAGPFEGLAKEDLPAQLCSFVRDVLRSDVELGGDAYDVVHSHYWLSGQVGTVAQERWGVPLVHTMHTMAKVKNASLAEGDAAEPIGRVRGEEEIVRLADRLIANTIEEARELQEYYGADPDKVSVVHPGVDLQRFRAGRSAAAREAVGVAPDELLVLFAGRIQPLKAPDIAVRAVQRLKDSGVEYADRVSLAIVGGPSGAGTGYRETLNAMAADGGVRFVPTVSQDELADWYAAASLVCVPSYNESFGLVAIEAQACGTPVVASRVGGLSTAVSDGVTGILVDGRDPNVFAEAFGQILGDRHTREAMSHKAVEHAAAFSWQATAEKTLEVYAAAIEHWRAP